MFTFKVSKPKFSGKTLVAGIFICIVKAIIACSPDKEKERPWTDSTEQLEVTLECSDGNIKHWFNLKAFINKSDFEEREVNGKMVKGMYFGTKPPANTSFVSTDGNNEQYLMDNAKKKRFAHDSSLVTYKGKDQLMKDTLIDEKLERGETITIVRESKMRTAHRMFGEFAFNTGLEVDGNFVPQDLEGLEVGTVVREIDGRTNKDGKALHEVHYFCTTDKAESMLAKLEE